METNIFFQLFSKFYSAYMYEKEVMLVYINKQIFRLLVNGHRCVISRTAIESNQALQPFCQLPPAPSPAPLCHQLIGDDLHLRGRPGLL